MLNIHKPPGKCKWKPSCNIIHVTSLEIASVGEDEKETFARGWQAWTECIYFRKLNWQFCS